MVELFRSLTETANPTSTKDTIFFVIIIVLALWDIVWKGFALWRAARNNQFRWFIALLIINSIGILPIVYLVSFQETSKRQLENENTKVGTT